MLKKVAASLCLIALVAATGWVQAQSFQGCNSCQPAMVYQPAPVCPSVIASCSTRNCTPPMQFVQSSCGSVAACGPVSACQQPCYSMNQPMFQASFCGSAMPTSGCGSCNSGCSQIAGQVVVNSFLACPVASGCGNCSANVVRLYQNRGTYTSSAPNLHYVYCVEECDKDFVSGSSEHGLCLNYCVCRHIDFEKDCVRPVIVEPPPAAAEVQPVAGQ